MRNPPIAQLQLLPSRLFCVRLCYASMSLRHPTAWDAAGADMTKHEEITRARKILELPETATMDQIKAAYRRLISRWHPDRCGESSENAHEMTRKITEAYRLLVDYCANYRYSFSEKAVKQQRSPEEWWMEQFGSEPLWSGKNRGGEPGS